VGSGIGRQGTSMARPPRFDEQSEALRAGEEASFDGAPRYAPGRVLAQA